MLIKTTDGGQNWFELSSGTTELLTDLFFYDFNIGYAVGFNETIIKTSNGGLNWFSQFSGISFDIYSVDFVDSLVGFAAGGRDSSIFLRLSNGQKTWTMKTILLGALSTPILNCVEFIDVNVGWAGVRGSIYLYSGKYK